MLAGVDGHEAVVGQAVAGDAKDGGGHEAGAGPVEPPAPLLTVGVEVLAVPGP